MLQEHTRKVIAAYVLNCPVDEAFQRQVNAAQKADIEKLEYAFGAVVEAITPLLKKNGEAIVAERNYLIFALMPSNMAMKLIQSELKALGIFLEEESLKQSLALALENSSGYILKTSS